MTNLDDGDYVLVEGAGWFDVGAFTVRIHKTDEGVVADIYDATVAKTGDFDAALMASTYAFTSDCASPEVPK